MTWRFAAVATRGSDPGDVDAFADLLIMAAAPETTVALQDAAIGDELTDLLGHVTVPTLVLHRRGDELVSADEAVQLAARIPGARLELVDGSDLKEDDMPGTLTPPARSAGCALPAGPFWSCISVRTTSSATTIPNLSAVMPPAPGRPGLAPTLPPPRTASHPGPPGPPRR